MLDVNLLGLEELIKATDLEIVERSRHRALRTGLLRGRTVLNRLIRERLLLKVSQINKAVTLKIGRGDAPSLLLIASSPIPLSEFSPVKTARGFSVKLKPAGGRTNIDGAFQFPAANQRIFRRKGTASVPKKGRYAGKYLREDIEQLFMRSLPQVADDPDVLEPTLKVIEEETRKEFLRQLQVFGKASE